jgi:Zn-dependent peptidase ImmA (M78 family)
MARETLAINKDVLAWAHARSGYSLDELKKNFKDIEVWLKGDEHPTYPQLERLADKLKLPVAVFFFPAPPKLPPIRESFRTLPDADFDLIPRTVMRLLRKAKAMQLNLLELNDGKNPASTIITRDLRVDIDVNADKLADVVREFLKVPLETQFKWPDIESALENWRSALASVGVFVFKDPFKANDYSGFCLDDSEFPIIYVNNSAPKSRQIFTLFHELAHLLFHTSGIDTESDSFVGDLTDEAKKIEVLCNRFAGRFLVPQASLKAAIAGRKPDRQLAAELARLYHVSREVIYRRFLDSGLIQQAEYERAAQVWLDEFRAADEADDGSGGNYYNNQLIYLGRDYVQLAFSRYYQNRIDEAQLAEYLNVAPRNLETLEARFSGRKA